MQPPIETGPLSFGLCADPSLYVFMQRANVLKRLNICAGSTKPSLFAYPFIWFKNALLVPLHKNVSFAYIALTQTDQRLSLFALCWAKMQSYLLSAAEPGQILSCVATQYYA